MNAFQKVLVSFLFSVFLFAVIVIFAPGGDLSNGPEGILILTSVFLTLFLTIFFCFNVRQDTVSATQPIDLQSEAEAKPVPEDESLLSVAGEVPEIRNSAHEELEELEAADTEPEESIPEAELAEETTAPANPAKTKELKIHDVLIAFGDDDIPYLVESSGLELVDGDLDEIARFIENEEIEELESLEEAADVPSPELEVVSPFESMLPLLDDSSADNSSSIDDDEAAELEEISTGSSCTFSIFKQPFTFSSGNPELLYAESVQVESMLQKAKNIRQQASAVIYEQNGIHYISSNLDSDSELDDTFAELVDSVVNVRE